MICTNNCSKFLTSSPLDHEGVNWSVLKCLCQDSIPCLDSSVSPRSSGHGLIGTLLQPFCLDIRRNRPTRSLSCITSIGLLQWVEELNWTLKCGCPSTSSNCSEHCTPCLAIPADEDFLYSPKFPECSRLLRGVYYYNIVE